MSRTSSERPAQAGHRAEHSLSERLDRAAQDAVRGKPFLVIDGRPTSYGEAIDKIGRLTNVFAGKGIAPGDRIAIVTEDPVWVALIILAALRSGIGVVNLNPDMTPTERLHALRAVDPRHVFLDRGQFDAGPLPDGLSHTLLAPAGASGGLVGRLLGRAKAQAPSGLAADVAAASPGVPQDPAANDAVGLLLFTSGTTSAPKVVELTHANLAAQLATFDTVYDYDARSRILNPLPLHFTDGILHGPIAAFVNGATLYRPARFQLSDTGDMLHGIYRDRITHFIAVPALLAIIDRLHDGYEASFATPDFRYVRSSGDRLPEALWHSVENRFGVRVVNTYGLSETVCEALYCGPAEASFRHGTIGKPVDCEVMLADDAGAPVADGEVGELLIRGTNIMRGYLNQPALTEEAIRDGWFRTGDLASIDEDGFVTIVGRKKALIISGGANIQPQDINDAMLAHPAVAEAYTLGLPDRVFGERVACAVVPREGGAPDVAELIEHCRGLLAPHKVPRTVTLAQELPRNPAGKVLADKVKRLFEAESDAPDAVDGDVEATVVAIAARVFSRSPDELRLTSDQRSTHGWDSLAHLNLILETERHFDIALSPRDVLRIARLEHLVAVVRERLGNAERGAERMDRVA